MTHTRRERSRDVICDEIKAIARRQMRSAGTATGISLRGIAAEMSITAPAIYRYFGSRDDLITALIVDAYRSLGDAIHAASDPQPANDYTARFVAVVTTYHTWALKYPAEFNLIYGLPVPNYVAPAAVTVPLVQRVFAPFLLSLQQAWEARQLTLPVEYAETPDDIVQLFADWGAQNLYPMAMPVFHCALTQWATLHGLVMLELNGQFDPLPPASVARLFRFSVATMLHHVGLTPSAP